MRPTAKILFILLLTVWGGWAPAASDPVPLQAFDAGDTLMMAYQDLTLVFGHEGFIRSPVGNKIIRAGKVAPGSTRLLTQMTCDMLQLSTGCVLQGDARPAAPGKGEFEQNVSPIRSRTELVELARAADKSAVLVGYVYRYEKRLGSPYGARRPASVAFSLHLLQAKDGQIVWEGWADETQKALTENLFDIHKFFKRKGRWVSANELARSNLKRLLTPFLEKK